MSQRNLSREDEAARAVLVHAHRLGVDLAVEDGFITYSPSEAAPERLVDEIRNHKAAVMKLLVAGRAVSSSTDCANPLTPHDTHELAWECDPDSCVCYRDFGEPRLCMGVPCRWVWPDGAPKTRSTA